MRLARPQAQEIEQQVENDLCPYVPMINSFVAHRTLLIKDDVITGLYGAQDCHFKQSFTQVNTASETLQSHNKVTHQFKALPVTMLVLLLHLLGILLINQLWSARVPRLKDAPTVKIQSYLYQAPQTSLTLESESEQELLSASKSQSELAATLAKELTTEQKSIAVSPQSKGKPKAVSVASQLQLQQQTRPMVSIQANSRRADKKEQASHFTDASKESDRPNVSRFTQSYLEKQRANQLDTLIVDRARRYTQKRSLSEMDADMQELIFPEVDEYSKVVSTDHRLDPNRIVRHGDTCYRIVKVPTQLNPYAENIGYAFNCGGDKVKKAINDAIAARLEKLMLPIKQ
ncbi:hypothetical protein L2719_19060 [Shewanella schlegeliana]|uniref:Uncharacterized protein n=1 Tax=Shewanella schlegeliana TaxID=190308 RepID=A0ABS1STX5_9GAMM|nr:hypothetical protein [Shewanella schlegeliana]MBL4912001.1 hypothetical protein [Shewanella schlegeliana]MCL1111623.1 hypothetical protein [Shewanella schlegeliana]GIU35286.1 hypothetical protein TUM4433_32470 [Shewanella schlegeliana]